MTPHAFSLTRSATLLALTTVLGGCAFLSMPPAQVESDASAQWQAPLPHAGAVGDLSQWWQSQGDPTLVALIEAAQAQSPGVAQALARIASARANQAQAGGALLPQVNAQVAAQRGVSTPGVPVATTLTGGLQAAWELDLVGANRAVNKAANAQVQGSQALWHDARVSVAAEVANVYYAQRHCQAQLALQRQDAASRAQTARLVAISAQAGFVAAGDAALAKASAADAAARATQQATACDMNTKALVALTAWNEPDLKQKVALALATPAQSAPFSIASVPAQTVAQRPDVFAAEREVAVASAQVGAAKAQRFPRLTLAGSIGALRSTSYGVETHLDTWSFGPLALTLPLFDGGQRVANVHAAQANYTQAVSSYKARVRNAVREVEEALLTLQSTAARQDAVDSAAAGFAQSLAATQTRFDQGLASLVELEDARRQALATQSAQRALELERWRAWIALYRASGGGFAPEKS